MRTPGRRGEKIKQEEHDNEFVRRSKVKPGPSIVVMV
jgi:hypothetical protein